MKQLHSLLTKSHHHHSDDISTGSPSNQALAISPNGSSASPPKYTRLSELYISSRMTILDIGLEYREQKAQVPNYHLDILRGSSNGITMNLHDGTGPKSPKIATMERESKQLYNFIIGSDEEVVQMVEKIAGLWCFDVPVMDNSNSANNETTATASTSNSNSGSKTTFAWKSLFARPPEPRTQASFSKPDMHLTNFQTGEVHAVYVTDLNNEGIDAVEGKMQFRRSFGQDWERLVLISLGSLLEKERWRRKSRGSIGQGIGIGMNGGFVW